VARGPGRPPHIREVFSFEDLTLDVPREVVLDTSFVVGALIKTETDHAACREFMVRLADADSTVYFNRILEIELAEVAFRLAVKERHGNKGWPQKRNDGRVRRRAARLSDSLFKSWNELLDAVPHVRIELHEVAEAVPEWMAKYGLGSMDAAHAITASYAEVDGLVTTDAGFGNVGAKQLRLYVDASRVRSCRRRRGGR
jgi:predicted nucleic acid-binding protein